MLERASGRAPKAAGIGRNDRIMARKVALAPGIVISASQTAQRLIRFSGEMTRCLFLAISPSIFGIRGDRILLIPVNQERAHGFRYLTNLLSFTFLATRVVSPRNCLQTVAPHLESLTENAGHQRLSWCSGTRWAST
jgi:hypothetical protein